MEYQLKRKAIADGVFFSAITDKKFKHNRLSVNFVLKLNEEKVSDRAIVPYILRQGSKSCPDFTEVNKRLDDLYGAELEAYVDKYADYQVLCLGISSIDSRYALNGENLEQDAAKLLAEMIFEPNIQDGSFDATSTQLEKDSLIDTINAEINDKRTYALLRCKSVMCQGEAVAIKKYGTQDSAKKITPASAAHAYQEILENAQIEILFEGAGDPEPACSIFQEHFEKLCQKLSRNPETVQPDCARSHSGEVKTVEDAMAVTQGKLVLGFRVENCNSYKEKNAVRVAVGLLGGTPTSLLFQNVREKLSLCYYCQSRYDRSTGIMMVDSGVDPANVDKVKDEVLHQISMMQQGDFEEKGIQETQLILSTALRATSDSLNAMESWYLNQILGGTEVSPEMEIDLCCQVTHQDIVDAMKKIKLDTVYTLVPAQQQ